MKIKGIKAREIIDSRGNPTVEVDLVLESGISAKRFAEDRMWNRSESYNTSELPNSNLSDLVYDESRPFLIHKSDRM